MNSDDKKKLVFHLILFFGSVAVSIFLYLKAQDRSSSNIGSAKPYEKLSELNVARDQHLGFFCDVEFVDTLSLVISMDNLAGDLRVTIQNIPLNAGYIGVNFPGNIIDPSIGVQENGQDAIFASPIKNNLPEQNSPDINYALNKLSPNLTFTGRVEFIWENGISDFEKPFSAFEYPLAYFMKLPENANYQSLCQQLTLQGIRSKIFKEANHPHQISANANMPEILLAPTFSEGLDTPQIIISDANKEYSYGPQKNTLFLFIGLLLALAAESIIELLKLLFKVP